MVHLIWRYCPATSCPSARHANREPAVFLCHNFFKNPLALLACGWIRRAIYHADAILTRFWKRDVCRRRHFFEELVRHLHQYARSVTGVRFATARTSVIEVHEDRQCLLYDLVRLLPLHVHDEPDTACVVLELWIV
jgi:hypothetical protein